jgi:molybdopterin/thiamine biosynthesis adenylyltransferase
VEDILMKRVVIVGLGGIGSHLAEQLCRILVYTKNNDRSPQRLVLIDGKAYKERNRERQRVFSLANKAETMRQSLVPLFPDFTIEAKSYFVDHNNILAFIRDGDIVFLCCDNHPTRRLLSYHVGTLQNALLISGGNELYDGNVQVYERKNGKDTMPSLVWRHPEIENPKGRNPAELSCEELAIAGDLQLLAANNTAAAFMLNAYTMWCENGSLPYYEIYFDLKTGNIRPVPLNQWLEANS